MQLARALTLDDLALHTQVVVRDSGRLHSRDEGWLGAQHRWTVAEPRSLARGVLAMASPTRGCPRISCRGIDMAAGSRCRCPRSAACGKMPLYVVLVKGETAGPAARKALELLQRHVPPAAATGRVSVNGILRPRAAPAPMYQ